MTMRDLKNRQTKRHTDRLTTSHKWRWEIWKTDRKKTHRQTYHEIVTNDDERSEKQTDKKTHRQTYHKSQMTMRDLKNRQKKDTQTDLPRDSHKWRWEIGQTDWSPCPPCSTEQPSQHFWWPRPIGCTAGSSSLVADDQTSSQSHFFSTLWVKWITKIQR